MAVVRNGGDCAAQSSASGRKGNASVCKAQRRWQVTRGSCCWPNTSKQIVSFENTSSLHFTKKNNSHKPNLNYFLLPFFFCYPVYLGKGVKPAWWDEKPLYRPCIHAQRENPYRTFSDSVLQLPNVSLWGTSVRFRIVLMLTLKKN